MIAAGPDSRLLRAVLEPWCPVPFVAWPGPALPGWAGSLDLVVVLAPEGSDTGAASAVAEAVRRGCQVVVACPPDSLVAEHAAGRWTTMLPTVTGDQLATAVVMLDYLDRVDLGPRTDPEEVAEALDDVAIACSPHRDLAVNPAKMLAIALADANPLVWGGSVLAARAARRVAESRAPGQRPHARSPATPSTCCRCSRRPGRATSSTTRSPTATPPPTGGRCCWCSTTAPRTRSVREQRGRLLPRPRARGCASRPSRATPTSEVARYASLLADRALRRGVPPGRPGRGGTPYGADPAVRVAADASACRTRRHGDARERGLFALLDDVAALARLAAASVDDVGAAAGRASVKAAGVVVDDTAVTPQYVHGVAAERELPIIRQIAIGSLRNKLLFILPAALLLSQFLPWLLTPLLMVGGDLPLLRGRREDLGAASAATHHEAEAATEPPAARSRPSRRSRWSPARSAPTSSSPPRSWSSRSTRSPTRRFWSRARHPGRRRVRHHRRSSTAWSR